MMERDYTNVVHVMGTIEGKFRRIENTPFFRAKLHTHSPDGMPQHIWLMIKNKDFGDLMTGFEISVRGELQTRVTRNNKKLIYLCVQSIDIFNFAGLVDMRNYVYLTGTIQEIYSKDKRTTFSLDVTRESGIVDRLSCVAFNDDAEMIRERQIGDEIIMVGHLQSREYRQNGRKRIAYEVVMAPYGYFLP